MTFAEMFFSNRVLVSFFIVIFVSIVLLFFPLVGTLGFEFSVIIAFIASFISVFLSAEYINLDLSKRFVRERRFSDLVSSIFIINFILIALPFSIALIGSTIKNDCYIKEGIIFYLLIPVVTVFFSTSLGLLLGIIFPRRGFFLGALILIATICYSLWQLYVNPPIFFYNAVVGFFPGPLYDQVIPVTSTLVVYRLSVVCWGILFLLLLKLIRGFRFGTVKWGSLLGLLLVVLFLVFFHAKREELGVSYTRDYITRNFLKGSLETEHFVIYYVPGTPEARQIDLIAGDHEWRHNQLKHFLDVSPERKIRSYIYPNEQMRKRLIGAGETTIANPIHGEIHLIYDSFPNPVLKHELTHVMSSEFGMRVLRISPKVGLLEGLAVAADWGVTNGLTPHQWSESMFKAGSVPDVSEMVGIGFWYAPPKKSYTLMGSFCRYLIDTYGIEKFKTVYRTGDFSVYGRSLDELISDWKKFLSTVPIPENAPILAEYRFSEPSIFKAACPRKVAALKEDGFMALNGGNLYEAKNYFTQALNYSNKDPVLIDSLAYVYYYDQDYDKLLNMVEEVDFVPAVDRNILENLRGNVLWQSGKSGQAEPVFRSLLEKTLPDDIKRELEIKLSAISVGGEIEEKMRQYFSTRDRLRQVVTLEEITKDFPAYAPAYYLLGRIFYADRNYQMAVPFLTEADLLLLPSINLQQENSRILGVSLFAIADYEGAMSRLSRIVEMNQNGALKDFAIDFMERCQWAERMK